jgi:hypothetical protein
MLWRVDCVYTSLSGRHRSVQAQEEVGSMEIDFLQPFPWPGPPHIERYGNTYKPHLLRITAPSGHRFFRRPKGKHWYIDGTLRDKGYPLAVESYYLHSLNILLQKAALFSAREEVVLILAFPAPNVWSASLNLGLGRIEVKTQGRTPAEALYNLSWQADQYERSGL